MIKLIVWMMLFILLGHLFQFVLCIMVICNYYVSTTNAILWIMSFLLGNIILLRPIMNTLCLMYNCNMFLAFVLTPYFTTRSKHPIVRFVWSACTQKDNKKVYDMNSPRSRGSARIISIFILLTHSVQFALLVFYCEVFLSYHSAPAYN